jgi:uncharacterized damage-inducible protein DinB
MTYYGARELAASFRTVRNNTIQIATEIPEESYGFRAAPDTLSVGELLAHIALATRNTVLMQFTERITTFVGYDFLKVIGERAAEEKQPRSKAELLDLLRSEGESFAKLLEGVTEDFLAERIVYPEGMMPPSKSRFEMLLSPKEHEMHHRGQLMTIERMLGITPHLTRQRQARMAAR